MNFTIVENAEHPINNIYYEFKDEFLNSNIPTQKLRSKYGLSQKQYKDISHVVKKEVGIERRPRLGKYFTYNSYGYILVTPGKKREYLGFIPFTKGELLGAALKLCKELKYDRQKCSAAIYNLKNGSMNDGDKY